VVTSFKNRFTLDKVVVNELQSVEDIKGFVLKYLDSNPQQLK
jgi:hypothetical protein